MLHLKGILISIKYFIIKVWRNLDFYNWIFEPFKCFIMNTRVWWFFTIFTSLSIRNRILGAFFLSVLLCTVSQYHAFQRLLKVKKSVRDPLNQEWTIWICYYRIKKGNDLIIFFEENWVFYDLISIHIHSRDKTPSNTFCFIIGNVKFFSSFSLSFFSFSKNSRVAPLARLRHEDDCT